MPTISVMGTGEAELKPDFARIFVTVETQADTVAAAASANNTASERVLARIQALGIAKDDIRTVNFQVFQTPVIEKTQPSVAEIHRQSPAADHHARSRRASASWRARSWPAAT